MAIAVNKPVTIFKESKALRINKKIRPKEIAEDNKVPLIKILKVNVNAKYKDIKNGII